MIMILSAHVADLKGACRKEVALQLIAHLEKHFGKVKIDYDEFIHTGVKHERKKDGVMTHQFAYVEQLKPLLVPRGGNDDAEAEGEIREGFHSLLGGVAWIVITRGDVMVYVQALQQRSKAPRLRDCRRLN